MFKTYLKIAWRNIARHKLYTAINVLGLALGVCACIVIYIISSYELSFDNFHRDKNRIFRVMGELTENTGEKLHFARLPIPSLQPARTGLTGVDAVAGIIPYYTKITIPATGQPEKIFDSKIDGTRFTTAAITEPQYFDIFSYNWLAGNATNALQAPNTVVLTQARAKQYFGQEPLDKIMGRQIIYQDSTAATVTGIIQDWDGNTDLGFTDFISFSSLNSGYLKNNFDATTWSERDLNTWIFTKLAATTNPKQVNSQLAQIVKHNAGTQLKLSLQLEPLSDIHFNADVIENPIRTAHLSTLYSLMAVAIFILLLAVINFINLSTAQSARRAKEVGVRKVLGSSKTSLVLQFLTETFLLALCAVIIAVCLEKPVLAAFSTFIPAGVVFNLLQPSTLLIVLTAILVTTLLGGLYPAKLLSANLPVTSLKGSGTQTGSEKWLLRKGLIIFQFTVSLVFIIGSIAIGRQLKYAREKDLGFTADAIITANTPWGDSLNKASVLAQKIKQIPGVARVAMQWLAPMTENSRGMRLKFSNTDVKEIGVTQVAGNEDYIPLYQIKLLAGRNLVHTDTVKEFVINESLCHIMGIKEPAKALGKILYWNGKPYPVVGVVADFHTTSLHDPVTPLCVINRAERQGGLAIKLAAKNLPSASVKNTLAQIEKAWKEIYPSAPFTYKFYDESLELLYTKDKQTATLTNTAMGIAVFISCIGLFGLALFTAEKRAKEISIRKILGASVASITAMLGKDFIVLVIIAIAIASPVAWYFTNLWLRGFAYRINLTIWIFLAAGAAAIGIALVTVSWQAIKAAIANPVKHLRSE